MAVIVFLARYGLLLLWILILARVLLSWIDPRYTTAAGHVIYQATEPMLAPIRRFMPRTGMIDFSPMVLFILVAVVMRLFGLP